MHLYAISTAWRLPHQPLHQQLPPSNWNLPSIRVRVQLVAIHDSARPLVTPADALKCFLDAWEVGWPAGCCCFASQSSNLTAAAQIVAAINNNALHMGSSGARDTPPTHPPNPPPPLPLMPSRRWALRCWGCL